MGGLGIGTKRKPLQGITNIIRFNWHYYVLSFAAILLLVLIQNFLPWVFALVIITAVGLMLLTIFVSLVVSFYIYDYSGFYSLSWLNIPDTGERKVIVNINAGFDETSHLLKDKYPEYALSVFDFYDPLKHTEVSIERARKAYPAYAGTQTISTDCVPLNAGTADHILLIFAAHEIRKDDERIIFFKQLKHALNTEGSIVIVEHSRDLLNFLAYNIGFLHFLSPNTWQKTFANAGLTVTEKRKLSPFVSLYTLKKNGITT